MKFAVLSLSLTVTSIFCLPSHSQLRRGHARALQHHRETRALAQSTDNGIPNSDMFFIRRSMSPFPDSEPMLRRSLVARSDEEGDDEGEDDGDDDDDDGEEEDCEDDEDHDEDENTEPAPIMNVTSSAPTKPVGKGKDSYTKPVEDKKDSYTKPDEDKKDSSYAKPVVTKPAEDKKESYTKPVVPKPVDTKPVTKPVETKPVVPKPVDTKPVDTKPVDTKPVETKPLETKPVETKPVEKKPAYIPPTPKQRQTSPAKTDKDDSYTKGGGGGHMESYTGKATYYEQGGAAGSCGTVHSDSDYIVAIDIQIYGGGRFCGKSIKVTRVSTGKSITCTGADECPGCPTAGSLDLSEAAFNALGNPDEGVFDIAWELLD